MMDIGIVGGGINGLCCAWSLAQNGDHVTLYERESILQATSCSSSKLLHGGIRYLENGQFRLVREALRERDKWLKIAPNFARPIPFIYPKYQVSRRARWVIDVGFGLYGILSGTSALPSPQWLNAHEIQEKIPELITTGLLGGYLYYDAQMDDYQLGQWVAEQCSRLGVKIHEKTSVRSVTTNGTLLLDNGTQKKYDRLLNVTGPWAEHLLQSSNIQAKYHLDLIRGSHLIINRHCVHALILDIPEETRIFFVLPWQGSTMVGTTEVRQKLDEPIACSNLEKQYLIDAYNHYFTNTISQINIIDTFAGLRPLLRSNRDPGKASREYAIQKNNNLITVFGGKWTTARALADKVNYTCFE